MRMRQKVMAARDMTSLLRVVQVGLWRPDCCLRPLSTTAVHCKNIRAGQVKRTPLKSQPLTYEQAQYPHLIGVTKSWNSWNAGNLHEENRRTSETTTEDVFIRKFMQGTFHSMLVSEVIIKRRQNMVVIAGLVLATGRTRMLYFLQGYTEELLSALLKRPVKLEIQTVKNRKDVAFKYV